MLAAHCASAEPLQRTALRVVAVLRSLRSYQVRLVAGGIPRTRAEHETEEGSKDPPRRDQQKLEVPPAEQKGAAENFFRAAEAFDRAETSSSRPTSCVVRHRCGPEFPRM